jgi:hypothetical protein
MWSDEKFVELTPAARLLFIGTLNFVDDAGRMEFSPKRLKMLVFPADTIDVAPLVEEILARRMFDIYTVAGKQYLQVVNFSKHQRVDRPLESRLPQPPDSLMVRESSRALPEHSSTVRRVLATEGNGREGNGSLSERESARPEMRYVTDLEDGFDLLVYEIGAAHPANAHLKAKPLPQDQEQAIAEAVQRDGRDKVLAGTRDLGRAVDKWPKSELRFVPNPVRFYRDCEYLKDPAVWEKAAAQTPDAPKLPPDYVPASTKLRREQGREAAQ